MDNEPDEIIIVKEDQLRNWVHGKLLFVHLRYNPDQVGRAAEWRRAQPCICPPPPKTSLSDDLQNVGYCVEAGGRHGPLLPWTNRTRKDLNLDS